MDTPPGSVDDDGHGDDPCFTLGGDGAEEGECTDAGVDVDNLSEAMASMQLERVRQYNLKLQTEAASESAVVDALRAQLSQRSVQAHELAQIQHELAAMVPQSTSPPRISSPTPGSRQPSTGDKRKQSESDDETVCWRAEIAEQAHDAIVGAVDDVAPLAPLRPSPALLTAAKAERLRVHEELRHELRTRARLEVELARVADQRAALHARLRSNDALIRRLESVNASLLSELQQMRDACTRRQDVLAKAAAWELLAPRAVRAQTWSASERPAPPALIAIRAIASVPLTSRVRNRRDRRPLAFACHILL
eukprot:CAMPEP_0185542122 /NCGR_PEP_ID=MMETSP1381-20130426/2410_1 /TAXON_ID=298111 /ORGANISM="Pavlova sp., Strain CCMP459" /LENGTH=307 /DNA_ID=CAMNT_0028154091 /DNA_START=320 /DNA_END=1244 /DNA_ORIENTATION=-